MLFGIYILSPQGVANFQIYSAGLRSVSFIWEVAIRGKEWRRITMWKGIVSIVSIRIKKKAQYMTAWVQSHVAVQTQCVWAEGKAVLRFQVNSLSGPFKAAEANWHKELINCFQAL